jgi:hypothetical protein
VRITVTLMAAGLLVVAFGCGTSIQTNYDYDVNANFEQYGTYNWIPRQKAPAGNASRAIESNDLLDKRIKTNVDAVLQEKGMALDTNNPDMLVNYYVGVQDKVQVADYGYRYSDYYWGWGGREIDVYNYEEGTLMLDFIDAATQKLVWRGAGAVAVDPNMNPQKQDELVRKVVGKILSKYPPKR